jgi:hypothetical protein
LVDESRHPNLRDYAQRPSREINYLLVLGRDYAVAEKQYLAHGLIELGSSGWKDRVVNGEGVPRKAEALSYAQRIGADYVLYGISPWTDKAGNQYTGHLIGFFAKKLQ